MEKLIIKNKHGVEVTEDSKFAGHYCAKNATCKCGEKLIVAPKVFSPTHWPGNPVMVCADFGIHAYQFKELIPGQQPDT